MPSTYIPKTIKPIQGTGAHKDPLDERDYQYRELVAKASAPKPEWIEKPRKKWRQFPIFDQKQQSSCVAHADAKLLGIENYLEEGKFVEYSRRDIYGRRSNIPGEGMSFREGMKLGADGATLEQLMPSFGKTEQEMNRRDDDSVLTRQIAKLGRGGVFVALPLDIDVIAALIQKTANPLAPERGGHGVMLGIRFDKLYNQPVPQLPANLEYAPNHHAITGVDTSLWEGSKRSIIIEDSWGVDYGFEGQRVITEDWFKVGLMTAAWYYETLPNIDLGTLIRPKYVFTHDLSLGMESEDVRMLQEVLRFEGTFKFPESTGYFGGITKQAVIDFQEKYAADILAPFGLTKGTGYVGQATIAVLNKLSS